MRTVVAWLGVGLLCLGCSGSGGSPQGSGGGNSVAAGGGQSSNVFVDQISQASVDKVDILFMIDNSPSMADKQEVLKAAVPALLGRLLSPLCVDDEGKPTPSAHLPDGTCAVSGTTPEFAPLTDIHIGIVSSSLGDHGGSICSELSGEPEQDDRAHLIGTVRSGLNSWHGSGFLAWDPTGTRNTPSGESDPTQLVTDFAAMVQATNEHGCGFEASLEAWYRFLIDPEPPMTVSQVDGKTVREGIDTELLAQRAAFLRPDSLLAIVMVSDENDCSIRDDGLGWMVGSAVRMPKATSSCALDPNDECCRSCSSSESSPPAGCQALSADPACKSDIEGSIATWDAVHDSLNLRCYQQQRRFGSDLLYPTDRYVKGLSQRTLSLASDPTKTVANPLFAGGNGRPGRDPSLVFLAGIVGVPWQDIVSDESLTAPMLTQYLTAAELTAKNRWPVLLGDSAANPPMPPTDPFMIEASDARLGTNPVVGIATAPANSTNPRASAINGHEQNVPLFDDLQYACTFPLITPKECQGGDALCDCSPDKNGRLDAVVASNSPLCQSPGGSVGSTQYFAKAYPGTRELTVLRDFGENGIAASICPKITAPSGDPTSDPNYGYNPAIAAILGRLKEALHGKCLPRAIPTTLDRNDGSALAIACNVIEVKPFVDACDCGQPGRSAAPSALVPAVLSQLRLTGNCGEAAGQSKCDQANFCLCQINQETGEDLSKCVANSTTTTPGFCYIADRASPALRHCPQNQQQVLRFVESAGAKIPAEGALLFMGCDGSRAAL